MDFTLSAEHIAILKNSYSGWNDIESGAPSLDPKYPLGSRNVLEDVVEAAGFPVTEDKYGEKHITKEVADEAERLYYSELQTALEIVLRTTSFEPGVYTDGPDWKKVGSTGEQVRSVQEQVRKTRAALSNLEKYVAEQVGTGPVSSRVREVGVAIEQLISLIRGENGLS